VIRLLTLWAAWRLLRATAAIVVVVVAALAVLLLGSGSHQSESVIGQLQRAGSPLEHQLQHTLQKAFRP
jgi:hypothetical protein